MALNIIDIITSILQSVALCYTITFCLDKKEKKYSLKFFCMLISFILIATVFTSEYGKNLGMSLFITHIITLLIASLFYRKNILSAMTAYTITYFLLQIYSVIFGNLIFAFVKSTFPIEYINYEKILIIYFPQWILLLLGIRHFDKVKKFHGYIIHEQFSIVLIMMSFFLDFILNFYALTLGEKSQLVINIIYIMFFVFCIWIAVYFWRIYQKSQQIHKLNLSLETKNNELRKIKHDYGAQISYLYMLCLMERFADLKKSLKDIINNNESTPTAVEINENENSRLAFALKPAIDVGIHVIVEENCDFKLIDIDEMKFYRIVSNIVNNAIKAMNGEGIIIAKSYEYLGNAVIKIENNGPKIPEQNLKHIFDAGFTTKDDSDKNHGYGLSIVKDLVESYRGKVYVKSTDIATQFKIVLPIKQNP